ncbi:hypothetical protein VTI74DRAFT_10110 [Chaetomium olivicolor]
MQVAPYEGLEVFHDLAPEVVNGGQHQKLHPVAGRGEALQPKNRICGLSRAIFWLAVAMTILGIIVIGLGIGLGVALSKAQSANIYNGATTSLPSLGPAASSSPPSSAPTSTPTSPIISSTSTSTSTSTGIPRPSDICPGANNTIVAPSLGNVRYRVACDSDFSGSGKQTLASLVVATWDDCLALCNTMNYFQNRADVGCTWNVQGTGTQTPGTCWCLGGADKTVVANRGNVAAVPQ